MKRRKEKINGYTQTYIYNGWRRINYTIRILNITLLLSSRPGHLFKLKGGA